MGQEKGDASHLVAQEGVMISQSRQETLFTDLEIEKESLQDPFHYSSKRKKMFSLYLLITENSESNTNK